MNPSVPSFNIPMGISNTSSITDRNQLPTQSNSQLNTESDMEGVENGTAIQMSNNNEASNQNTQLNRYSIEHPQGIAIGNFLS